MYRFYGSLKSSTKTLATCRGTDASGVTAHVRGCNIGGEVSAFIDDGCDCIHFLLTGGTNNPRYTNPPVAFNFKLHPDGHIEQW